MSVPLHCAALGKVLLAFGAAELPPGRLERRTAATLTSRAAIQADLDQVRQRGFAVTEEELEPGLVAVAAPVYRDDHAWSPPCRCPVRPAGYRAAATLPRLGARCISAARDLVRGAGISGGCLMTQDELLKQLYDFTLTGNAPEVLQLTPGLDMGMGPEMLLYEALIPSLEEVGARFERGDFFVPEMLIAGKAMAGALDILRPLLAETGAETIGKIVMGTVKGDVHDIGKNLVNIMFEGAGFEVIDLGVQVAPEKFIAAIEQHQPDIVGFSAFLTTTMPMFKANINALQKAGLRDQVIVMVGGAPVTQEYADVVGADGYASDASAAVVKAKELLGRRRALARA